MAIPQDFYLSLLTYARLGSSEEAAVRAQFAALFAAVNSGGGKQRASFSADGTSASWQINASNEELFAVYGRVVRALDGTATKTTHARFC
jgi:hypothetical protein